MEKNYSDVKFMCKLNATFSIKQKKKVQKSQNTEGYLDFFEPLKFY
jgi:hypothetical protein